MNLLSFLKKRIRKETTQLIDTGDVKKPKINWKEKSKKKQQDSSLQEILTNQKETKSAKKRKSSPIQAMLRNQKEI